MSPAGISPLAGLEHSRWVSLRYFNLFRLTAASIFMVFGSALGLGQQGPRLFTATALIYLAAVLALGFPDALRRLGLARLVTLQVVVDVLALTTMMWTSGGYRSGLPIVLMVVLAGAGLVAQGRMVLFYAALASVAMLSENAWRYLLDRPANDFFQVGLVCIGFFGIALTARLLARRAQANEYLAAQRGVALASQQALNARIIRDMPDGVIVVGADGTVRQANPRASVLLGVELKAGSSLGDVAPALLRRVWHGDEAARQPERFGPSSRLLSCRVVSAPGSDALIYLSDYERLQRQAQHLKLAALGRLTANIAHEIRNPLAAITHAAELLDEEDEPQTRRRLSRIIQDNGRRIERMVRDVLALGRRDQIQADTFDPAEFVRQFVDELVLRGEADPALFALELQEGLSIAFDRTHLHQILWNLVSNARRYCSGGAGAVRLRVQPCGLSRVQIEVADDGPGIAEPQRAQVFEPFFTTDSRGTGLGLYIARELAEANSASLELADAAPGAHFILNARCQL